MFVMEGNSYFDNAATTFPKPDSVYSFADHFYRTYGGNAGRGNNFLAQSAREIGIKAKDNLRRLYSCPNEEIVFTASATEALNRIIFGLDLKDNENVYITPFEHNAVTRPLNHLVKTRGIKLNELSFYADDLMPDLQEIKRQFEQNPPKLVVMTHASNVCGAIIPVLEVAKLAKVFNAYVVVDMSQTCGLLSLQISSEAIDYAVFAGHKTLYAPFGIGGFFCRKGSSLEPVLFGGNGINSIDQDMPRNIVQMSEVGSQNVYAIAGLYSSTNWLLEKGMENIKAAEASARKQLLGILKKYNNIHIIGENTSCEFVGVVSAIFDEYSPDEVEYILGRFGVAVRAGLHCAPYAHRFLNTLPTGTVRFSVSALTSAQDLSNLDSVLSKLADG